MKLSRMQIRRLIESVLNEDQFAGLSEDKKKAIKEFDELEDQWPGSSEKAKKLMKMCIGKLRSSVPQIFKNHLKPIAQEKYFAKGLNPDGMWDVLREMVVKLASVVKNDKKFDNAMQSLEASISMYGDASIPGDMESGKGKRSKGFETSTDPSGRAKSSPAMKSGPKPPLKR